MNRGYLFLMIVVLISSNTIIYAQNFASDIKNINSFYEKSKIELKIMYKGYSGWETQNIHEQFEGKIKKSGNLKYEQMSQFETIYSDSFYLTVDNLNKKIGIYPLSKNTPTKLATLGMLDSVSSKLMNSKNVIYSEDSKGLGVYEITLPAQIGLAKVSIVFNKTDFSLKKLVLFYYGQSENSNPRTTGTEKYRVEMVYLETNIKPRFSANEFTYANYLHLGTDGKLTCNTKYIGYKLNNLMSGK